jgi:hypothetical protein
MRNYGYVTVNPSDYAIVFKNGNIIKEGRGFRFYCTPRIQYVIIPGNVKNITFVADQISKENQGVEVSGFAIWKVGDPKKIYQNFDFNVESDTMEQVSVFLKDVVESAIRHMVANMTIEEVLRKRGTIIVQLKKELEYISEQWGIVVDTIEIKNVRIQSKNLFDNMQAQFRNAIRLEAETNTIETERQIEEQRIHVGDQTKIIKQQSELADRERKKKLQLQEINDKAEVEKHQREQDHARKKEEMTRKWELFKEEEEYKRSQMLEQNQTIAEEEKLQALQAELELKKKQLEVELEKYDIAIEKLQVETENLKKDYRVILAENLPAALQNLKIDRLDLGGTTLDTLIEALKEAFGK